jgi:hypothetical protein
MTSISCSVGQCVFGTTLSGLYSVCGLLQLLLFPPCTKTNWKLVERENMSCYWLTPCMWEVFLYIIAILWIVVLNTHISNPGHTNSPPVFNGVRVTQSFVFCVVFCKSFFVSLSLFDWSLYCLALFDWSLYCLSLFDWSLYCLSLFDWSLYCLSFE